MEGQEIVKLGLIVVLEIKVVDPGEEEDASVLIMEVIIN